MCGPGIPLYNDRRFKRNEHAENRLSLRDSKSTGNPVNRFSGLAYPHENSAQKIMSLPISEPTQKRSDFISHQLPRAFRFQPYRSVGTGR